MADRLPDPRIHPHPTSHGAQTAIVVGLGEPIHTDRDHRIKVQFHWQRGANASHRLAHPDETDNSDNAPASDPSGTWVRVGQSVAGANWGAVFTPRLGQEVLVQFMQGGHGLDLSTAAWGAVRAGSGMLLSAHAKPGSQSAGRQIDSREPATQIEQSRQARAGRPS